MKHRVERVLLALALAFLFIEPAGAQTPDERLQGGAMEGEYKIVEEALKNGAAPDSRDEYGMTALMWASSSAAGDVVDLLLKSGADVNLKDNEGWTALRHAFEFEGAYPDPDNPEFHQAFLDCIKRLIAAGADASVKDNDGISLIELAGTDEVKALLNKAGAKD